jgi:DNA-binding protein
MIEKTTKKETVKEKRDENTIYVGNKPPMSYVLAVVTQFNTNGSDEVVIKARGRSISRAVDTAEIVRNRFITDAEVKEINISTEVMTNEEGRTSNVSSIEICLSKKKGK